MFSFFKKADNLIQVDDCVWMTEQQKMAALQNIAKEDPLTIFICWFSETREKLTSFFSDNGYTADNIYIAPERSRHHVQHRQLVFTEHHPLHKKEEAFYSELQLKSATVYSSLDEPILQLFGGERIISLVQNLGIKDGECLQHKLITASIKKALEKLAARVVVEQSARSQKEWLQKNITQLE